MSLCGAAVYADGRVCISILHSPGDDPHGYEKAFERWSPVHTVRAQMSKLPWDAPPCVDCLWTTVV